MSDHEDVTITQENAHPKVVPQITTITNISAKFPYLKKGDAKSMTTDNDGNLIICPPITVEKHQQVQREEKARTILLSALPDEHMDDFYHMIDARDIWNAIKARFGLDKGYDKMQKILTQMNTLKIKSEQEDVNMKFLRELPPFWSGIALILKTKGGLEYISFDDLYNKLMFLEIDTKGYSSNSSTISNAAFVSTAGSSQGNLSYQESGNDGHITTHSVSLGSSSSKGSSKSKCSVVDDVIYSFFVHKFEKKHGRKIKFNGRENARFDKKLVKCFNCKKMGYFLRECQAQGGQNSNNYQKYKSKEVGKDGSDSKAIVVGDGSIDWDKQTDEGNTEPRSLENFGMIAGIKIESDADSEGEVVSANAIPTGVSVSASNVAAAVVSPQSKTEFALMVLSIEAKWNNSGKNLYKLIYSSMSVRTKRGLGLDKYIGEGELGIDDSQFSIFYINSDDLEGQPIYNRFALVDHIKAVPPPLSGNYMPPSNIPDINESQMVYGKKATDSSEIKSNDDSISYSNDSVHFDFSDRSSKPSTNELQTCDSSVECSRPNHSDRDSTDYISSVSAPTSESGDTIVIDCDKQEDFPSICSIETDVKSFKLYVINCDLREQRFTKRNAEGKGKLGRRPIGKQVNPHRPKPVSTGQPNPVSAGQPNPVSAGDGILGPRPLNIQTKSKYFHSFTHNNQQIIFLITHNSFYSFYMTGGLNGKTAVKPSVGWPWTQYGMSKTNGSKINGGSKSKSWSYAKGPLGRPKPEMTWIRDQSHRVFFTKNKCLVLSKDFPLPDPSMVILSIPRKHNLYTFNLNELAPKGPLTCLIAKASQNESTLWHRRLGHVNFRNVNKLVKGNLVKDSDDEPDVLIIHSTPTLVVPIVDEATTQNDGKEEADQLGLAFPSLNLILGVGSTPIGSSVSASSTPPVSAGSTPPMSLCASPISAGRPVSAGIPTGSAGRPVSTGRPVSAGKSTGSAVRPVSAGRPSGSAARTPIPVGRILGKLLSNTPSERFPRAFSVENLDIHDGVKIFDCPRSGIFTSSSYDEEFSGPDANNLASSIDVSSTITKRIHNIHPTSQILGDINSPVQTRSQVKQKEPTTVAQALADPDWVENMQAKMQQFRNKKVWVLVTLPDGKRAIGTKWILKNKRDAKGIVCRNMARLVAQGHKQEERIDYTNVFAPVARIEAIRLFLAFASFIGFKVYQMDVKSAFHYEKIAEEVYVTQPKGFEDPDHPKNSTSSTRTNWCEEFESLMQSKFEMSSMGPLTFFQGLQVDQRPDGIFIHQEKEKNVPDEPISVHLYRSMIGCLMYLTATRPDIMFAVCAAARHQVTPKTSNLLSVKRIFKYLTAYPKLGLWYPRDSPFDLEAFSDSDYAGAHGDRKSTIGGCQFLQRRYYGLRTIF
nr:hypothetical protein [Tanacetum cinerariifolium]